MYKIKENFGLFGLFFDYYDWLQRICSGVRISAHPNKSAVGSDSSAPPFGRVSRYFLFHLSRPNAADQARLQAVACIRLVSTFFILAVDSFATG